MIMFKNALILQLILATTLFSSSFITDREYGERLFKDPRGIGCNKCHGENGSGKIISEYVSDSGKPVTIFAPSLKFFNWQKLKKGIKKHSYFVPKYFLTKEELISISRFLEDGK